MAGADLQEIGDLILVKRTPQLAAALVVAVAALATSGVASPTGSTGPTVQGGQPQYECTVAPRFYNRLLRRQEDYGGPRVRHWKDRVPCMVFNKRKQRVKKLRKHYRHRLETDGVFAIAVAFDPIGRTGEAMAVARCESHFYRFAQNGQYKGLFQLSAAHRARMRGVWSHAYDNARHAAITVASDGGWGQWECKP